MASYTDVASARSGATVTPSDSGTIPATRALLIGVAGTVYVDFADGGTNVKCILPAGVWPLQVTRVYSTNTTATDIVALY